MIKKIDNYSVRDLNWIDIIKIFLCYIGVVLISLFIFILSGYNYEGNNNLIGVDILFYCWEMVLPVIIIMKIFRNKGLEETQSRITLKKKDFLWFILIEIIMLILVSGLAPYMSQVDEEVQATNFIVEFVIGSVYAPIAEELLIKGVILAGLIKKYGPKIAIIVSALIFGILHVEPAHIILTFISGIITGYIYYRIRRVTPLILMHSFWNTLLLFMPEFYAYYPDNEALIYVCSIGYIALSFSLFYIVLKKLDLKERVNQIQKESTQNI